MHRLQPIAQIGQRARGDGRERIDEIAFFQCAIERRIDNRVKWVLFGIKLGRGHSLGVITALAGATIRARALSPLARSAA